MYLYVWSRPRRETCISLGFSVPGQQAQGKARGGHRSDGMEHPETEKADGTMMPKIRTGLEGRTAQIGPLTRVSMNLEVADDACPHIHHHHLASHHFPILEA